MKVSLCNIILHGQFLLRPVSFRNQPRAYQNWDSIKIRSDFILHLYNFILVNILQIENMYFVFITITT